ncbi:MULTISPECIES: PQQ-dependent sugar dehydrogenase [Lysobacteraceae]|uniref:PQQ-dependent sugar dehydrogenase n=1 Tax=Lysobacteraceae TaxID=32033 RepID=UPI001BCFA177|nr:MULTISPECIES: PQQ-dependent sugar dehydrogenase [Lysobacter]
MSDGNRAPTFTSAASVAVPEDTAGVFYTASASDMDGNPVTFSLVGGADAAQFTITRAGALAFVTPPNFEAPTDSDANNLYTVQLGASDGTSTTTLLLSVTVTDRVSVGFRVRRVVAGMTSPVLLAAVPDNSGRVFVGELAGRIRILSPSTGTLAPADFLDLRGQLSTDGERGLLGFATAPDFAASGLFYVFVTDPVGTIEVRRYRTSTTNRDRADPATLQLVLRQPHPRSNHNGGWLGFGPDGMLYIAIGDGGGFGDPDNKGQDRNTLLGKILRVDVARDQFPGDATRNYGIPTGNPFASAGGAPEVWAFGLRNPFRNSFDPATGNLFIGDVGEDRIEEIDMMRPADAGANFGWSIFEGTLPFRGTNPGGLAPPVAQYMHGTGTREGNSVTGGVVYRGPVDSLRGHYLFSDFIRPNVWSIPVAAMVPNTTLPSAAFTLRNADFAPDAGAFNNIVYFGTDQTGNVYLVDLDGEVFVIEAAPPASAPLHSARAGTTRMAADAPSRHFCIEAWNGRTVRWSGDTMILGGEGFTCVRKHYETLRARMSGE